MRAGLAGGLLAGALIAGGPAQAQAQPAGSPMPFVRADRWAEAQQQAAGYADPVPGLIVAFYRLLAPGGGTAEEIAGFAAAHPDWPAQALLARRREEALAADPDPLRAARLCQASLPALPAALARCAAAMQDAGDPDAAARLARAAWVAWPGEKQAEAGFLLRWAAVLGPDDQAARFDRLAWTDTAAAARQAERLAPSDRPAAQARLALRRDDPAALGLADALPPGPRDAPAMVLERARFLRRAGRDAEALALWLAQGTAAEQLAPAAWRSAFWAERNLLARRLLRAGDPSGAYALAAGAAQTSPETVADAAFLAGWLALRRLDDPHAATAWFGRVAHVSAAVITRARAQYWLGRAAVGEHDQAAAAAAWRRAAAWPTTFYGQLAVHALGQDLAAVLAGTHDPPTGPERALALARSDLARAAVWLAAWNEPRRAATFLLRLAEVAPTPADDALAGRLAQALHLPAAAVGIARRAGRDGTMLPDTGWPAIDAGPDTAPGSDLGALVLAVMRQESSFDAAAASPAGALGLMQLLPATAAEQARILGMPASAAALTADPALNARLGTAVLRGLLGRFDGSVPLAVAAYNAGASRVAEWLAQNGDPRQPKTDKPGDDMIDWIEQIPFAETRNYVQRVIENAVVYRARRGELPEAVLPE